MADVKKSVEIEVSVVSSDSSQGASKAVQAEINKLYQAQIEAHKSVMDRMGSQHKAALAERLSSERRYRNASSAAEANHASRAEQAIRAEQARRNQLMQTAVTNAKAESDATKSSAASITAAREKALAAHQSANEKIATNQEAMAEQTKALLGGTLQLARGLAVMGLAGEENTKKMLDGLIKIQSVFDLASGGLTVLATISKMMRTWTATTKAQTAANVALATSQALVNRSAVAGAGSIAGRAAAGAVAGAATQTGVVAATGAAGAGGAAAAGGVGLTALAGSAVVLGSVAIAAAEGINLVRRSLGDTSKSSESIVGALISWRKAANDAKASTEALAKAEDRRQRLLAEQSDANTSIAQRAQLASDRRSSLEGITTRVEQARGLSDSEIAERSRLRSISEIERAEAEVAASQQRRLERQRNGQFALIQDELQAASRLQRATDARASAEERVLGLSRDRLRNQQSLISATESELKAANERAKTEQAANQSKLAQFANLGKGGQAAVRAVSEKVAAGKEITRADRDILEQSGFGSDLVTKFDAKRGASAGGLGVLQGLGEVSNSAAQERDKIAAELSEKRATESRISQQVVVAQERYIRSLGILSESNERLAQLQAKQQGVGLDQIPQFTDELASEIAVMRETIVGAIRSVSNDVRRTQAQQAAGRV